MPTGSFEELIFFYKRESTADTAGAAWLCKPNARNGLIEGSLINNGPSVYREKTRNLITSRYTTDWEQNFVETLQFGTKKLSFDDFLMTTWNGENESQRKKKPQIPRLSPL